MSSASSSSSKAASILRASLARRTDLSPTAIQTSSEHNSRTSRSASHRSYVPDANFTIDGDGIEGVMMSDDDPSPLTGGRSRGGGGAFDFDPVSLSASARSGGGGGGSGSSQGAPPLGATSFLHHVSSRGGNGRGSSNGSAKQHLTDHLAASTPKTSSSLDDPIPYDNSTEESVRHGSGIYRLVQNRRLCALTVAALALIGVVVGVSVHSAGGSGSSSSTVTSAHGSGPGAGGGTGSGNGAPTLPGMGGTGSYDEPHVYKPEPTTTKPVDTAPPPPPSTPTTTTTSTTTTTGTTTGNAEPAETATWLQGLHFEEPMLSTLGSALSFSRDGTHIAISAKNSDIIQVMKRNADGTWSHVGATLPGKVAALSGDGSRIAVANSSESSVVTYENYRGEWVMYGPTLTQLWGVRSISLDDDGSTLVVSHHPDPICRLCPSVATIYEVTPDEQEWLQKYDMLGAYDFDFSVVLSSDGTTLAFSGRVFGREDGIWGVKSNFPDFITSHSALSADGKTAAISLPDCHIFKNTDPTQAECTNTETHEVSVMEFHSTNGGWWNRKGISIGPELAAHQGTTSMALSGDGNTIAIAIGGRGLGGEVAVNESDPPVGGDAFGTDFADELPPLPTYDGNRLRRRVQENEEDWSEDWMKYDSTTYAAYETDSAFVQVYRYDENTGDWGTLGEPLPVETSGAVVALTTDGSTLAVGVPYGGSEDSGYVKIYDLVMQ
mmetsp:Transcript_14753/g.32062  ORF Transcript_14753/g.32062 Transcript_14753/m.32062 type:complete len:720 (-) Transcript_14753:130-2289(-)|eukprot:CAMPEP_0178503304 /NCGR_PEP_ID=MMETSP0696-20121128/17970_1 /TAXON_ID=265572 /ORGANISM="Extubocellulus spinifer, Strain CCMP396" /LENGTH=719 /DNA_ID=CAMNT_0020132427 /DNA_START=236 /DNA_END=2395 /DNA_ORIENTATION=-